jgi:pimeloyl-ACP methyl ester carboxylesterase
MDFVRVNEHRIAYWRAGSGVPLVLVHGSFATSSAWKRLAANLDANTWHAVALDLPGWGESDPVPDHPALVDLEAAAVQAVAKQVSDGPIHLAGHSHGGTVALAVALAGRVPVRSLTLFEPLPVSILPHTGDGEVFREVTDFVSGYRRAFEAGEKWAARAVIELWGGSGAFEAMAPAVREFIAARTAQNLRNWQGCFAFRPSVDELRSMQVPTTLVHGEFSNSIAKLIALRLKQSIPNGTIVEMSGASHFMIHTHAPQSARLIGQAVGHA